MLCPLDQVANHADGLCARVVMDIVFLSFCLSVTCSKMVVTGKTGWPDSSYL